ncbi:MULTISPECIES: hypothetical protein [unclassified Nocardioides]|uniref:hypothetical protein n=1 Tax=unclassified Nocardioides TaxID=2615069 RepID=UPI00361B35E5
MTTTAPLATTAPEATSARSIRTDRLLLRARESVHQAHPPGEPMTDTTTSGTTTSATTSATTPAAPRTVPGLSARRLNVMRVGYLFMGLGLVIVKWPMLPTAYTLPLYESVTLCLLVAMSVLALIGLRYPARLLPVLLRESAWKVLWLSVVALPQVVAGDLDRATTEVAINCFFGVVVLAVVPWRHVLRRYVLERSEPWRAGTIGAAAGARPPARQRF